MDKNQCSFFIRKCKQNFRIETFKLRDVASGILFFADSTVAIAQLEALSTENYSEENSQSLPLCL